MKHAIGKTVASVETESAQLATYDKNPVRVITSITFTDGSRITFFASEVEHGDPVPRANYHGRPR